METSAPSASGKASVTVWKSRADLVGREVGGRATAPVVLGRDARNAHRVAHRRHLALDPSR